MEATCSCQSCGHVMRARPEIVGKIVRCTVCKERFIVQVDPPPIIDAKIAPLKHAQPPKMKSRAAVAADKNLAPAEGWNDAFEEISEQAEERHELLRKELAQSVEALRNEMITNRQSLEATVRSASGVGLMILAAICLEVFVVSEVSSMNDSTPDPAAALIGLVSFLAALIFGITGVVKFLIGA